MRALFAFSGGGSGFPGSPVAGVYLPASSPEFLTVCAAVVAVPYSIVVDVSKGGLIWYSTGSAMSLIGGSVNDVITLATVIPETAGGVDFEVYTSASVYNNDDGLIYGWNSVAWVALS